MSKSLFFLKRHGIIITNYGGGINMPIKIDVLTNVKDGDLTIETCSQIIEMLQTSYKNMRKEMYTHFLDIKYLKKELVFIVILAFFYILSKDMIYIYFMPISVFLAMLGGIISAEYITTQTRKQITNQIQHFIEKRDRLIRDQKIKV